MKKLVALFLLVTVLFTLAACSLGTPDIADIAKKVVEEYGDNAEVYVDFTKSDIEYMADQMDISDKGVYALFEVEIDDDGAYVIFCEKSADADKVYDACLEALEDAMDEDDAEDYVVKKLGNAVFVGHEDILEVIEK